MFTNPTITDITSEEFETPVLVVDLGELIKSSTDYYYQMAVNRNNKKQWRDKLNELIDDYNEKRQLHIYNHVK